MWHVLLNTKPDHCLKCCMRNEDNDACIMQKDEDGEFIEFDNWEEQMASCPIKELLL